MSTRHIRLLVLCALLGFASPAHGQEAVIPPSCVVFGTDSTGLWYGSLAKITFPGPPNYESIVDGDVPEDVIVLVLPQDACWVFEFHVFHTQLLQLIGSTQELQTAASLVGREVEVNAKAALAESGHHHTSMMLDVTSIRPRTPTVQGN